MIRRALYICFLIIVYCNSYGNVPVTGCVTTYSEDKAIAGVNIRMKESNQGVITDLNGNYYITAEDTSNTLIFSYVGYQSVEAKVGSRSIINIALKTDVGRMDEIVVIGYGGIRKKELTGAVATIHSEAITQTAGSDLNQTLQGQLAGISIQSSSGAPGAQSNIHIRGIGSFSASSVSPLYIVDGIPQEEPPVIAPEEIESVYIVKDGATAAIYGTRASNGVIHIVTKKGRNGDLSVSYSSSFGIQKIPSGIPLMNTRQQIFARDQEALNNNLEEGTDLFTFNPNALEYDSDFQKFIERDHAGIQNHTLLILGGKKDANLSMVTNYFNQEGVLVNSGYKNLTTRFNSELTKERIKIQSSINAGNSNTELCPVDIYTQAITQPPYHPLPITEYEAIIPDNQVYYSTFAKSLSDENTITTRTIGGNLSLNVDLLKGLSYKVQGGGTLKNSKQENWQPRFLIKNAQGVIQNSASRMEAQLENTYIQTQHWSLENLLTYNFRLRTHEFTLLTGHTCEAYEGSTESAIKSGFQSNTTRVWDAANNLIAASGRKYAYTNIGLLSRIMYNYNGRYMGTVSLRNDGSSRFGEMYRRKWFWGGSVGWNISEELFFSRARMVIDQLKVRASLAEVGNDQIPYYIATTTVEAGSDYHWGREGGETVAPGYIQRGYANPEVHWETNISRDIGFDLTLFKGLLTATFDAYYNSKKDMLLPVSLAPSTGTWMPMTENDYKNIFQNVGNMYNKGIELSTTYQDNTTAWRWMIQGTFSKNINEVTQLPENLGEYSIGTANIGFVALNQPVPTYMLIPTNGVIKDSAELAEYNSHFRTPTQTRLGDLRYVDTNGDSVLNAYDRVPMGSPLPDFEMGLNIKVEYKNIDLVVNLFYSHGSEIYNGTKAIAYQEGRHLDQFYQWTPVNNQSDVPALRFTSSHWNQSMLSDQYLEDGTYLRFRNIILGYSLPRSILHTVRIEKLRFYINLQNPITLTRYTGFDPDIGYGPNAFGMGDPLFSKGIDAGNYPTSRKFLLGVQLQF